MPNACKRCIAETERRLDAIQILCELLTCQVKAERRRLEEVKSAIAATDANSQSSSGAPGDSSLAMLEG